MLTPHVVVKKEDVDIITNEFLNKIKDVKDSIEKFNEKYKGAEGSQQAEQK
jgi:hypothetical protein